MTATCVCVPQWAFATSRLSPPPVINVINVINVITHFQAFAPRVINVIIIIIHNSSTSTRLALSSRPIHRSPRELNEGTQRPHGQCVYRMYTTCIPFSGFLWWGCRAAQNPAFFLSFTVIVCVFYFCVVSVYTMYTMYTLKMFRIKSLRKGMK